MRLHLAARSIVGIVRRFLLPVRVTNVRIVVERRIASETIIGYRRYYLFGFLVVERQVTEPWS